MLQNAQDFVTKCALSQNAQKICYEIRVVTKCAGILLRNARCYKMRRNFVTKCRRCYIMRSCYKMRLNKVEPKMYVFLKKPSSIACLRVSRDIAVACQTPALDRWPLAICKIVDRSELFRVGNTFFWWH